MTDEFDEKLADVLAQPAEPSARDVLEVMRSGHRVTLSCFKANRDGIKQNADQLGRIASHLDSETRRMSEVESRLCTVEAAQAACPGKVADIVRPLLEDWDDEHEAMHQRHLDREHPTWTPEMADRRKGERREMTEGEWQGKFLWSTGKWAVGVAGAVIGGLLVIAVNMLMSGRP